MCVCATTRASAEWLSPGPAARGEDRCYAIEGMARLPVKIPGQWPMRCGGAGRCYATRHRTTLVSAGCCARACLCLRVRRCVASGVCVWSVRLSASLSARALMNQLCRRSVFLDELKTNVAFRTAVAFYLARALWAATHCLHAEQNSHENSIQLTRGSRYGTDSTESV